MNGPVCTFDATLAARVQASIRRTAATFGVTLQEDAIDDLVQDTYVSLLERRNGREVRNPSAYAARTARNVTIDNLRHRSAGKRDLRKTAPLSEVPTVSRCACSPEEAVIQRIHLQERLQALRRLLSPRACRVILMIYGLGLTSREVAASIGLTPSGVDGLVHRARARLQRHGISVPRRAGCMT